LPAYQLWYIAKYANTRKGRAAKIGVFLSFLPVIAICSVIWGFLWAVMLWVLWRDIIRPTLRSVAAVGASLVQLQPILCGLFKKNSRLPKAASAYWSIATMMA
jgi:hypothetical protein